MSKEQYQYSHSVEELDNLIKKIEKGITPLMDEVLRYEVDLRMKELLAEEGYEDDALNDSLKERAVKLQPKIEKSKRAVTKHDIIVIKLSEEAKAKLREEMSTSIVRTDPESIYNKTDEEIYDSAERRDLYKRLKNLKNAYFNPMEYINAMKTISDAIEYSAEHDYPWMSKEEVISQINEKKIVFSFCEVPHFYVNYTQEITDPEILAGIVNGTVQVKQSSDEVDADRKAALTQLYKNSEGVYGQYQQIPYQYQQEMYNIHRAGGTTPISGAFKMMNNPYKFNLSNNPLFDSIFGKKEQKQNIPLEFDWLQENAGEIYWRQINGIQYGVVDVLEDVSLENGKLSPGFVDNGRKWVAWVNNVARGGNANSTYSELTEMERIANEKSLNEQAAKLEADMLQAMRMTNAHL